MFTAHIVWLSAAQPETRLETSHPGFSDALRAGLFANGFLAQAPELLHVSATDCRLEFGDGTSVSILTEGDQSLDVMQPLPECDDADVLADDDLIRVVGVSQSELANRGIEGAFAPVGFGVMGPEGPVDLTIAIDSAGNLRIEQGILDEVGSEFGLASVLLD